MLNKRGEGSFTMEEFSANLGWIILGLIIVLLGIAVIYTKLTGGLDFFKDLFGFR